MKLAKKMTGIIYSIFRKFKNKYLLTIFLTALLPLIVTLVLVLNITARHFQSQQINMMLSETSLVETALEEKIQSIYQGGRYLSNYLSRALPAATQEQKTQSYNELQKLEQIQYNISFLKTLCGLKHIQLYSDKIPYLTSQTDSIEPMAALDPIAELHPEILNHPTGGKLHFFVTNPTEIQFYKGNLFEGRISFYDAIYTVKKGLQEYYTAISTIDSTEPQRTAELPDQLDQMLSTIHHPDEIDHVMGKFSSLVRDHLRLMDSVKQREMEIEKYKFKVLQEQINPHFLYNALETLRLCMILNRSEDALQSLDSLSRFYRIALSKGRDTLSIREELDMITNYLQIENIGYSGSILWTMNVEEECLDYPIPKFLLQPLVENSILHSRADLAQTPLQIDVSIHKENDFLHIIVRDNGSGIEPETLQNLQDALAADSLERGKIGFGLGNVNRRLKLFYGSSYGLQIRSVPGCTENVIRLPIAILW